MSLTKKQKTVILDELKANLADAKSVVFADYQGVSVKDFESLRGKLRESGVKFQVCKKTLMRLAAKDAGFEEIPNEVMEGPIGAAFSMDDEIAAAKILHDYGKKNEKVKLRGALFEGRVLTIAETMQLAMLPGKEELLAKLVYLLNSPIQGFHGVLHNTLGGFVRVLNAVKEKQEQAA